MTLTTRHLAMLLAAVTILAAAVGYMAATLANPSVSDAAARAMAVRDQAVLAAVNRLAASTNKVASEIGMSTGAPTDPATLRDALDRTNKLLFEVCRNTGTSPTPCYGP